MSEATLPQIWHTSVKTCRLVKTTRNIVHFVETRRHIFGQARMRPRNMLGQILIKSLQHNVNFCQIGMPFFQGAYFLGNKKKMVCFRSTWLVSSNVFCQSKIPGRGLQIWPSRWPSRHGRPDMTFETLPSRMVYRLVPGPSKALFCD